MNYLNKDIYRNNFNILSTLLWRAECNTVYRKAQLFCQLMTLTNLSTVFCSNNIILFIFYKNIIKKSELNLRTSWWPSNYYRNLQVPTSEVLNYRKQKLSNCARSFVLIRYELHVPETMKQIFVISFMSKSTILKNDYHKTSYLISLIIWNSSISFWFYYKFTTTSYILALLPTRLWKCFRSISKNLVCDILLLSWNTLFNISHTYKERGEWRYKLSTIVFDYISDLFFCTHFIILV